MIDNPCIVGVESLRLANHAVDQLLNAFTVLIQTAPNIKMLLVGRGEEREALEQAMRQTAGTA